jgi:hypothetical protein
MHPTLYRPRKGLEEPLQQQRGGRGLREKCRRALGECARLETCVFLAAEHHDLDTAAELPQPAKELQAVHLRHAKIHHDRDDLVTIEQLQTGPRAIGSLNMITAVAQVLSQRVEPGAVVIDQCDTVARGRGAVSIRTNADLPRLDCLYLGQMHRQHAVLAFRPDLRAVDRFVNGEGAVEIADLVFAQETNAGRRTRSNAGMQDQFAFVIAQVNVFGTNARHIGEQRQFLIGFHNVDARREVVAAVRHFRDRGFSAPFLGQGFRVCHWYLLL